MPNFPLIKNQGELNQHLEKIKVDLANKQKWLTRTITSSKKDSSFFRLIKKILNLFPGDRFAKVRADNVARGMVAFCKQQQSHQWIDNDIASLACEVLDLLQDKTKNSKKSAVYKQEIENAKKEILALVIKGSENKGRDQSDNSQKIENPGPPSKIDELLQDFSKKIEKAQEIHTTEPLTTEQEKIAKGALDQSSKKDNSQSDNSQTIVISGPPSKIDELLQDFSKKIETAKEIHITEPLAAVQEKIVKEALDRSSAVKKVVVSPEVFAKNKKFIDLLNLNINLVVLTDSHLSKEQRRFYFGKSNSGIILQGAGVNKLLKKLAQHIEEVEEIEIEAVLTSEQEGELADLIAKAPKLQTVKAEYELDGLEREGENRLVEAICSKKGLKEVSCFGGDQWLSLLAEHPETIETLHIHHNNNNGFGLVTPEGIQKLAACPNLKKISLSHPDWFIDTKNPLGVQAFVQLPHLEKLKLDSYGIEFLKLLPDVIENSPCLSKLELFFLDKSPIEALDKLSFKKTKIDEIAITFGPDELDKKKLFDALSRFNLRKLTLRFFDLDYEDYKDLERLTSLEELTIHYPCDGNEVGTIEKLLKKLSSLKKVKFYPTQGFIKHSAKFATHIHGNSLLPHELSKLQKLFEGRDLMISADRANRL